jgi:hypothetical protein
MRVNFKEVFRKKRNYVDDKYCEEILKQNLSATEIDSLDNSNYKNATFIHDMNTTIPQGMHNQHNTVINAGNLKRIFNISWALNK